MRSSTKLLFGAVALAAVAGCRETPLSETPMVRDVVVADLLDSPAVERDGASVVRVDGGWPADTVLDLKGRVRRREGADEAAAVLFTVEVDGREVLSRTIVPKKKSAGFNVQVPLDAAAGRPAEVALRIHADDPARSFGRWLRAVVETRTPLPRAPASGGSNLLLVVVDTWRADHCSLYGYPRPTTPNLERLAATSVVFERAISQCSWTAPAVASILTGLYPLQHGVIHGEGLKHRFTTVGEVLQAAGVTTFAVSTNPLIDGDAGYAQGIETFHHVPWKRAAEVNRLFYDWLPGVEGVRWFAYLHYTDPHSPYDAPAPDGEAFVDPAYEGRFRDPRVINRVRKEINFGGSTDEPIGADDLEYLRGRYDGEILSWDRHFGELIDSLQSRGLLDDTVVVVTSDHGEEFREHGKLMHGHHLYEESVRVPLLVRAPDLEPGRRRDLVETRGIHRAVLQLTGVADSPPGPGDLLAAGRPLPVFSHTVHKNSLEGRRQSVVAAVRDDDWKLIYWPHDGRTELFDLAADAGETLDLAAADSERAGRYRDLLEGWLAAGPGDAVGAEAPSLDPELVDKLRALGYVP
jgi:arylsulfatase A-like enzyme